MMSSLIFLVLTLHSGDVVSSLIFLVVTLHNGDVMSSLILVLTLHNGDVMSSLVFLVVTFRSGDVMSSFVVFLDDLSCQLIPDLSQSTMAKRCFPSYPDMPHFAVNTIYVIQLMSNPTHC